MGIVFLLLSSVREESSRQRFFLSEEVSGLILDLYWEDD